MRASPFHLVNTPPALIRPAHHEFEADIRAVNLEWGKASNHENKAVTCRVEAGRLLIALRVRVEAQGKDWWPWFREAAFVRSRRDAEKVMALALDRDPHAAVEEEREKRREGMARSRANAAHVGGDQELCDTRASQPESGTEADADESRDAEVNATLVGPAFDFLAKYQARANAWEGRAMSAEARAVVVSALHQVANALTIIAQRIDGIVMPDDDDSCVAPTTEPVEEPVAAVDATVPPTPEPAPTQSVEEDQWGFPTFLDRTRSAVAS
jgi:hypothetical protein